MAHSFSKLWTHVILATRNSLPFLGETVEQRVYDHIQQHLKDIGCPVLIVNGMPDHVHGLFLLSPQRSVAEVTKLVKEDAEHWINEQEELAQYCHQHTGQPFSWHSGYAAYSVSESIVDTMYQYIKNQKRHHQQNDFWEEYDSFNSLYRRKQLTQQKKTSDRS